jgi:hypothetical protein
MSTKFVIFTSAHTKKPLLVNRDHVRTATEVDGRNRVRLVMDQRQGGEYAEEVEGDLNSVWAKLTKDTPDVDLTWGCGVP